ncbi:hypothetical protein [Mangrovimonas sp. DI 80]|uniref:hypothetical protein n=1 Tax=Mangrovimonas sp. DI 80 TaxID=1779330 RepID=UPI000F5168A7|nr:hypothetical protein [Mangrovimonas sp. DI 80]
MMKIRLTNYSNLIFGLFMLFAMFSCQVEPLNSEKKSENALSFVVCNTTSSQVDLIAGNGNGNGYVVGTVYVEIVGSNYIITYTITNDMYCLTETHLSVVDSPSNFPVNGGGNPKIGNFEWSGSHDCIGMVSYTVPTSYGTYIAAHAKVNCISQSPQDVIANLPSTVQVCVEAKPGTGSYFDLSISEGTSISGISGAWCLDYDTHLNYGDDCFDADVYTIFDDLSGLPLDYEETLGAINWILNQDFISQGYTMGEIQFAIWKFIEDEEIDGPYLGEYTLAKALEIYNAALSHLDFEPGCGDLLGVILMPQIPSIQPTIITIPIDCYEGECSETAWGDGCGFSGNSWATYFQYGAPE